ncbi:hypothetical protein GGS24DRAFT_445434, partial [Hypoxylon argillaceum]
MFMIIGITILFLGQFVSLFVAIVLINHKALCRCCGAIYLWKVLSLSLSLSRLLLFRFHLLSDRRLLAPN